MGWFWSTLPCPPRGRHHPRYLSSQWKHNADWSLHDEGRGEAWYGFEKVYPIAALRSEIALVPVLGHSPGHSAIAVKSPTGWLLHCGDAFFHRNDLHARKSVPLGLRLFQSMVDSDRKRRIENMDRIRTLHQTQSDVHVFCSHDPVMFHALSNTSGPPTL